MVRAVMATSILALLVMVAACGGSSRTSSGPATVPGVAGYLHVEAGLVEFLQWQTDAAGRLQGTADEAVASGRPPLEQVSTSSGSFSGHVSGDSLSLVVNGHTDYGTLSGTTLTLNVRQRDGSIQPIIYRRASAGEYNRALAILQHAVAVSNSAERRAESAAHARGLKAARVQAAANMAADSVARVACNQFGGLWASPGLVSYSADGYNFSIPDGPQNASCRNVPYLGSDDATYYVTVTFDSKGAAQAVGGGTGTATESECRRGYYPDAPAGPSSAAPGTWSSTLGICLES